MTSSILTNTSAMIALQNLRATNASLAEINNQISTGKKVANARDNAAVFAISQVMESDVEGFRSISESLSLGSSTIAVASNATNEIGNLLNEIKGKIVSANEENVDRATLQNEIEQLRGQIESIVSAAQFNGQNLLEEGSDITVLSSLDRSSAGEVTARNIEVTARDFSTNAGSVGTGLSGKNASIAGTGVTGNDSVIQLTDDVDFLNNSGTQSYTLTLDGIDIEVTNAKLANEGIIATATTVASEEDVLTYLEGAINGTLTVETGDNVGLQGVTATVRANAGTPANAELVITSTASEAISVATDAAANAAGAEAAVPTAASLAQVNGQTNTATTVGLDLGGDEADAAGETLSVTVGSQTFTYTAAGDDADSAATAAAAVAAFTQQASDLGISDIVFEVDATTDTQINISNLNSGEAREVTFDTANLGTTGNASISAPGLDAAAAGSVDVNIAGNIVEGDSFSVTIGSTTATYVAGANEDANDVIRGLQNVIAADGPADALTSLTFASNAAAGDEATLSISSVSGATVSIAEARGGTEGTGDLYGLSRIDVTTADGATRALSTIENLIQVNVDAQAEFGASERRIEIQSDFMSTLIDSFKSGIGALVDADLEEASARLQALQVQQQLGVQALSIANQAPQNILALFQ
ncbi:MAG: flagellin [Pseudomonadota bacterium]